MFTTTKQQPPPRRVVVGTRVEPDDLERLRDEAQRTRRTVSAIAAEAIHRGLQAPTETEDSPW